MRSRIIYLLVIATGVATTGALAQAEEDNTAAGVVRPGIDVESHDIEILQVLDAQCGYARLQGPSLFLTNDVKKGDRTGYWFDVGPVPHRPALVCDALPGAWDVAVDGGHAFVCDYTKAVTVYDLSDRQWRQAARLAMPSMTENIVVRDKLAYIANHTAGLTIVDISTPSKPSIVSNLNPKIDCDAIGLSQSCAVLYAHWESRLVLVDISDPAKPRQVGVYQNAPKTFNQGELAIDGGFAYCTAVGGLVIVDITDPSNPKLAKDIDLGGRTTDVVVEDRYAFVAAGPQGVLVFDVSDPTAPTRVGYYKARQGFAASQIAVKRTERVQDGAVNRVEGSGEADYLIYVANSKGPAMVLRFRAAAPGGDR